MARLGYWDLNVATGAMTLSAQSYVNWGIDPGEPLPTLEMIYARETEASRARHRSALEELLATGRPYELELEVMHPDGSLHFLTGKAHVSATSEEGRPARVSGISHDVTSERKTEALAEARKRDLEVFINTLPTLASMADPEGSFYWLNQSWFDFTGMTPGQMEGRGWQAALDPATLPRVVEMWTDALAKGERFEMIFPLRRSDGVFRSFMTRMVPVLSAQGGIERWVGTSTEVDELEKTRNALALGVQVASLGLAEIDYATGLNHLSGEAAVMFGLGLAAVVVPRAMVHAAFHPDDREELATRIADCLNPAGPGWFEMDHRVVWPTGQTRWLRVRKQVYFKGEGKSRHPERAMLAAFDVTDSKKVEEALVRSEKLASVGRMASTIAHEINNPLETIGQSVYLALMDPGLSDESRGFLDLASREVERAALIMRQTLSFNRDRSMPRPLDPVEVVSGVLRLFETRIASRGAALRERLRQTGCVVAFAGEMRQVLSNLLSNSLDALGGGGRIDVRTGLRRRRDGTPVARIVVADTGSGISAPVLNRIFEPFFTTKEIVGTGLGLWISKQLVEKPGGQIRVRSRLGVGTVFVVDYPLSTRDAMDAGARWTV